MFDLHQTISQLVSSSGVSVQNKSCLKAIKTPPWASLALSFRTASKQSEKISEFLISGVNQDSIPNMMSGFAESIIVWSSAFLFFIDWQLIIKILRLWVKAALAAFLLASLGSGTIGEEAAGKGAMMSDIRLSGSDREESESNRFWVSREAVVSNSDVEKFGILDLDILYIVLHLSGWKSTPHFCSHAASLSRSFCRIMQSCCVLICL